MCKGAQIPHKRSGAQAQAKRLKPQIEKRRTLLRLSRESPKGDGETLRGWPRMKEGGPQGLKWDPGCYEPQARMKSANVALEIKRIRKN